MTDTIESLRNIIDRLEQTISDQECEIAYIHQENDIERLRDELDDLTHRLIAVETERDDFENSLVEADKKRDEVQEELKSLNEEFDKVIAENDMLTEAVNHFMDVHCDRLIDL